MRHVPTVRGAVIAAAIVAVGCSSPGGSSGTPSAATAAAPSESAPSVTAPPSAAPAAAPPSDAAAASRAIAPPAWLGRRALPRRPDGFGQVRRTPPLLRDRRLRTRDTLPPPDGARFRAGVSRVPEAVAARSTWSDQCPVALADLRYVTVSFWGFDDRPHTGELLVHRTVARDIVRVFRRLHRDRFPIEEMRIVRPEELDLPPTGDGNNTTSFVCRATRQATSWSRHAYGLALDLNPFHNPYVKGDLVLPERARAYTNRRRRLPGMVEPNGIVVAAFADIGWRWGGRWRSHKDWMHFSDNGR